MPLNPQAVSSARPQGAGGGAVELSLPVQSPPGKAPVSEEQPEASCAHCGLSVPSSLMRKDGGENFCCSGCRTVFHLLRGAGLEEYYGFRDRLGEGGRPVKNGERRRDVEFDSPGYQKLYVTEVAPGRARTEFLLEGVHCAACVWLVERVSRLEPSVVDARLDMGRSLLSLEWETAEASLSSIAQTLAKMGYIARPKRGQESARMRKREERNLLLRIGVSGAVFGNVMLMAFALYSGSVGFDEAGTMAHETRRFFEILSLIVSLPALWAGSIFYRGALAALKTRTPHMDLPIAIGIGVGFLWGAYGALWGRGEIYFDSITGLIFFLLIGRYLQRKHQLSASDAAELFHAVVPSFATVLSDAGEEASAQSVPTESIAVGATVLVKSGEVLTIDGTIREGHSSLDKALLSGESRPVSVGPGDHVEAGTLNLGSSLLVIAERSGRETRVARLMEEVEKALSSRPRIVAQVDRIAGVFTVAVLGLALIAFAGWSVFSVELAVQNSLALLIVACPCALGLATPLALSAGISQAAKVRKLVFNPEALEKLAAGGVLVLDKTGTLSEGKLTVARHFGEETVVVAALAAESEGTHPVARSLQGFLKESPEAEGLPKLSGSELEELRKSATEHLGGGVVAKFRGSELVVGSERFVRTRATLGAVIEEELLRGEPGASPVLAAWQGQVQALLWVKDRLRADAAVSLKKLRERGFELHLLSGDHPTLVEALANELAQTTGENGLFRSVTGGVTPEEKLARVQELKREGRTLVMVGDGVNDAGALAQADVGVAVNGAAEAARLSADVYLAEPGVQRLLELFEGASRVLKTIRRGIVFSLLYNFIGISAAGLGLLGPLWAAVLMPLSSLTVVTNAYRSRMFRREDAS